MSRRRAYPQPQYATAQPAAAPQFNQGYDYDQLNQNFQAMNVQPNVANVAPPANQAPDAAASRAHPAYGQQAGAPAPAYGGQFAQNPQNQQQQYNGQQPYNASYGGGSGFAAGGANGSAAFGGQQGAASALPLNQLYTTDLSKELPPSISDLSLPPPPIILPLTLQLIPSSETANAPPEYFRSTLNVIPSSSSLLKKSKLPLALVVRPYNTLHDETEQVPVAKDTIISRCRRCRGYINPFVSLTEGGRRWRCNFCSLQNDIPTAFDYDDLTQKPANRYDRAELNYSVVEFVAPKEYMARAPQPIVYTFIIDVSQDAINSGMTSTVARTILESLDRIPNKNKTARISIIGVDSNLYYFRFKEGLQDGPDILVVSDLDEPFLPSPEGLLVNLEENRKAIENLLLLLPSYFEHTANKHFALGPALRAGHKMIASIGGKLIVFAASLPSIGEGKLSVRDESAHSGKPKESQMLLNAADKFYKSFAVECNSAQVTIDLFLTGSKYQDVATLSNLPRYTAGQTHFYPSWICSKVEDVNKLSREVSEHLSMDIALEAVLRVRCSTGFRMSGFFGNFFNRSSDLCSFPTFPRDQSYVIEVNIEESIGKPVVFFQAAVLHSTCFGERRIRVMNLAIPTSSKLEDIYASADQLALTNYYTHRAIEKTLANSLSDGRDYLIKSVVDILNVFKKDLFPGNFTGGSSLQVSTNLRMLPLLMFSLTKHLGFREQRVPADHRAIALNKLGSLPLHQLIKSIYPTVYSLHNMPDECGLPEEIIQVNEKTGEEETITSTEILLPEPINDTKTSWENYGLYLIDNGSELFLWVSGDVVPGLVQDLFGTDNLYAVQTGKTELPEFDFEESEFNYKVRQIIAKIREQKDSIVWKSLYIIIGGSSNEPMEMTQQRDLMALRLWALSCLVEDKTQFEQGYREFLTSLRSKITA